MAGYKENFGGNLDYAGRGVSDVTNKLQRSAQGLAGAGKGVSSFARSVVDTSRSIGDLSNSMKRLKSDIEESTDPNVIRGLRRELDNTKKSAEKLGKQFKQMPFDLLEKSIGSVVGGLLKLNTGLLSIGFDFIISSIKRVYELQEKWTKAIGGFNMKIGGMTAGLRGVQKAATQWSSTMRGLTGGDIEEGIQMFGEFTMAMGRTVKAGDGFSKLGLQIARGFGIGGAGSGQILKVFENIGMSADDSAEAMKTSIKAANAAGIPVNMLAEDLSKSTVYMARFGKEGQKTLIQGAAWARKYDISLEQLRASVESFDMFDDAAKSASKLNTAFGTMINSMDLMMEDDPAKRMEMIRQQMLAQGMTYDKLSPKQRRYFTETMKLSEDQVAALLDSKNAGESYADFQAKADAKQKHELSAKKTMEEQLQATVQTMWSFGMAFDRVTIAIGKAIRPLLEVFGLAKKGGKDMTSFGGVMESITKTVERFFVSLSENQDWNKFMITLAEDIKKAGSALKDFVMSGRAAALVGDIAVAMKKFYGWVRDAGIMAAKVLKPLIPIFVTLTQHLDKLVLAWGAMKGFNLVKSLGFGGGGGSEKKTYGGMFEGLEVGSTKTKSKFSAGRGLAGAAAGIGTGMEMGGTGAMVGGAIGGLAGAFVPIIGPLLGPIGAAIGKGIESLFGSKEKTAVENAQERLTKTINANADATARHSAGLTLSEAKLRTVDNVRNRSDEIINGLKKGKIKLDADEMNSLKNRITELDGFGKKSVNAAKMLKSINDSGEMTPKMLADLKIASEDYNVGLMKLRESSEKLFNQQMASFEMAQAEAQKQKLERDIIREEKELTELKNRKKSNEEMLGDAQDVVRASKMIPGSVDEKELKIAKRVLENQKILDDKVAVGDLKLIQKKNELEDRKFAIDEKIGLMNSRKLMMEGSTGFKQLQSKMTGLGMSDANIYKLYLGTHKEEAKDWGIDEGDTGKLMKMATGGVVTRPTKALVGEAGPEAVIPLNRLRENLVGGGSAASSGGSMVTQIADIHLDGQKVGRALVRSMIQGRK